MSRNCIFQHLLLTSTSFGRSRKTPFGPISHPGLSPWGKLSLFKLWSSNLRQCVGQSPLTTPPPPEACSCCRSAPLDSVFAERFAQVAPKLVFRGALLPYPSGGAAALPEREKTPAPVPCPRLGCVRAVQVCLSAQEYLHEEAFADQALLLRGAFTLRPFCGPHNANYLFSTAVLSYARAARRLELYAVTQCAC